MLCRQEAAVVEAGASLLEAVQVGDRRGSAALKNAIDWLSRSRGACALLEKAAALLVTGCSPTGVEAHLEQILGAAGARVLPTAGRALNLRTFDAHRPEQAPVVQSALNHALGALQIEEGSPP